MTISFQIIKQPIPSFDFKKAMRLFQTQLYFRDESANASVKK